jgi:hypothetical protein
MSAPNQSKLRIDASALIRAGFALIVLAFFVKFVGPGLNYGFNGDDAGNIYYHWTRFRELLINLPLFFTTYCRPMGGLYFATLYLLFGVDPLPYHIVTTVLLALNTFLAFRFARLITGSELIGGITAILMVYHVQMIELVYLPAYIFDVLCFTFYVLAANYYLGIRSRGSTLKPKQVAVLMLLYIGALESKEIGATLPVILLLYELIYNPPLRTRAGLTKWIRHEALSALIAGVITAVYIVGKLTGAEALTHNEAYKLTLTWERYWDSTRRFVNNILYCRIEDGFFTPASIVILALALLLYAVWRRKEKYQLLMWCYLWIAPLPITFVPGRSGGMLYIPLLGWAVLAAGAFVLICSTVSKALARVRIPPKPATAVLVLAGITAYWITLDRKDWWVPKWAANSTGPMTRAFAEVKAVCPKVKRGAKIYVYNSPPGSWDTKFVMELVYGDRTTNVWLDVHAPLSQSEIDAMDYVFTFEDGRLKLLRGAS